MANHILIHKLFYFTKCSRITYRSVRPTQRYFLSLNKEMSCSLWPVVSSWEQISPTTEQNLNPCPEQGDTIKISLRFNGLGCQSIKKCSSFVKVYMQVAVETSFPGRRGTLLRRQLLMISVSSSLTYNTLLYAIITTH
jgi:hypothetical protein